MKISELDSGPPEPWMGYDYEKKSLAVIAMGTHGNGVVLWTVGPHVRAEIEEGCLYDLGDLDLVPPTPGIWVWEGRYKWDGGTYENPNDGSTYACGTFRQPTDEEWVKIRTGECPWNDDEWKLPAR